MTDDEFDAPHPAPMSPHDRVWRHPAEHSFAQRELHFSESPPLGRRLTALTAVVSLMSSVAVLVVAVPRGISTLAEVNPDIPQISVPLIKGNVVGLATIVDSNDKSALAIPLGNGCWLVSTTDLDTELPTWITTSDGQRFEVAAIGQIEDSQLAVLKAIALNPNDSETNTNALTTQSAHDDYNKYRVMDIQTYDLFSLSPSLAMSGTYSDIPVMTPAPVRSLAVVIDEIERIVGIVVRRGYSTWMLGKEMLAKIMAFTSEK